MRKKNGQKNLQLTTYSKKLSRIAKKHYLKN